LHYEIQLPFQAGRETAAPIKIRPEFERPAEVLIQRALQRFLDLRYLDYSPVGK
jgi:hypothetical protein